MNKKMILGSFLIMISGAFVPSLAMFNTEPLSENVTTWAKEEVAKVGVNPDLIVFRKGQWATRSLVAYDMLYIEDEKRLSLALEHVDSKGYKYAETFDKECIALSKQSLKHEAGHIVHRDHLSSVCAVFAGEIIGVGVSSYWNKFRNKSLPTGINSLTPRRCFAFFSIGYVPYSFFRRWREREADDFALRNADSRLELEMRYRYFKKCQARFEARVYDADCPSLQDLTYVRSPADLNSIVLQGINSVAKSKIKKSFWDTNHSSSVNDKKIDRYKRLAFWFYSRSHPYHADRSAAAKIYLKKWDAEHKN